MSPTKGIFRGVFAACVLALAAQPAHADDLFNQWRASAYAQALGLYRPQGLPQAGVLNSDGLGSGGFNQDGLFVQKMEAKLWGPIQTQNWFMTLGTQTDLSSVSVTDAYVEWLSDSKAWSIKAGQERLPFGSEEQTSSARLLEVQRALVYGFGNYGHVTNWGLGILAERGYGLRADYHAQPLGWLAGTVQSGIFQAQGSEFNPAAAILGRAALQLGIPSYQLELGVSGHASHASLTVPSTHYAPLGSRDLPSSAWEGADGSGDKATVLTWGQDASLDLGLLHLHGELAMQSLGALTRGGGKASAALDLAPGAKPCRVYGSLDQAASSFGDGVHQAGALYKAQTLGLFLPLPWGSGLKLEHLHIYGDDFPAGFGSDTINQAQWQIDF
jgi:hypothetical protein